MSLLSREIKTGARIQCELANDDSCDKYDFVVDTATPDELAVQWKLAGCNDSGELRFANANLNDGRGVLFLCQGSVAEGMKFLEPGERPETHTAPFLFPRSMMKDVREGKAISFSVSDASGELSFREDLDLEVIVGGEPQIVKVKKLADDRENLIVWVTDDESYPILLRAWFSFGNYLALTKINDIEISQRAIDSEA
jgi:hypothetical protein